jgi:hypothetical protein
MRVKAQSSSAAHGPSSAAASPAPPCCPEEQSVAAASAAVIGPDAGCAGGAATGAVADAGPAGGLDVPASGALLASGGGAFDGMLPPVTVAAGAGAGCCRFLEAHARRRAQARVIRMASTLEGQCGDRKQLRA